MRRAICERLLHLSREDVSRIARDAAIRSSSSQGGDVRGPERGDEPKGAKPIDVAQGSPAWYAAWTRSHCEHSVAQQLAAKGFETFVPEMAAWSRRAGEPHLIHVPMFPGYLFVHTVVDKHRYVELLKARGLVRILGESWDRLAPVDDDEIAAIQRVVAAGVPVLPHAHLGSGDRVIVIDGPLTGLEGLFVQDRAHKGRLVLSVNLLGRSVAVEVDRNAVVPSSAGPVASPLANGAAAHHPVTAS
jgi:transcription termination/antitermination protein NusG